MLEASGQEGMGPRAGRTERSRQARSQDRPPQTWHLPVISGLPSLQYCKEQLSVVQQLVCGVCNVAPKD